MVKLGELIWTFVQHLYRNSEVQLNRLTVDRWGQPKQLLIGLVDNEKVTFEQKIPSVILKLEYPINPCPTKILVD